MKLTKRLIDHSAHPPQGQVFLRDDALNGFGLRITPGSKTFILERRIDGQPRRLTLGRYGDLTVEEARSKAQREIGKMAAGENPADDRRRRRAAGTVADLWQRYETEHLPKKRPKSQRDDRKLYDLYVKPWAGRPLRRVTSGDLSELHTKIGTKHPYQANRLRSLLSKMFALGIKWQLLDTNLAADVEPFHEEKRTVYVQPGQFARLWKAIQAEESVYIRAALFLALVSGARIGDVLSAKWEHLNLADGILFIPHPKQKRAYHVPLPPRVLAELQRLPRLTEKEGTESPYLFPGRYGRDHLINIAKPWDEIRKRAGMPTLRIHDLRRTAGSWLRAGGADLPLIGKTLGHSQLATTMIYTQLDLGPVKQALVQHEASMAALIAAADEQRQEAS